MALSQSRRRFAIGALLVLVVALAGLHLAYPLPYVYRVCVYRGPAFEDMHRFPAASIASPKAPSDLPHAPNGRGAEALLAHPDLGDLDDFLVATETSALLVVHRGQVVLERYGAGYDAGSAQNTFSVSKSVTSALVGLAVRDGLVALDDSIIRWLPELAERDERFAAITVEHLLDMRSGIRFDDEIAFPIVHADNPLIYYHPDLESVLLERTEIAGPPGDFLYNNYNPPLLGLILRRAVGMSPSAYLERELWGPLGAEAPAGWTIDDQGFERMESGFHAVARDQARLGLLYLAGGAVAKRQILPTDWVRATTELAEPVELERYIGRAWVYRAGWWVVPRPTGLPDVCAIGHFGQFLYLSPQHDAVFVRNGPGHGEWGDYDWTELFYGAAERL